MSLIDSLTSEDLPLSYRFPRWNDTLYYPCASIVIFDIDTGTADSEVEYHIFVAEKDVNPLQIDPHASVIMRDGNWRDLTGKAITTITSVDSDSATETTVTLTINFDDLTEEEVSFTIPLSQGGGADSESVAIRVNSDGTLNFGGNFVGDSDSIRTQIKTLLDITDSRLVWEEQTVGGEQRFYLTQFLDDAGAPVNIEQTDIDDSHPGNAFRLLYLSGTAAGPILPDPFAASFFILNADVPNHVDDDNIPWDIPAPGMRLRITNPTDRTGTAFIRPNRFEVISGGRIGSFISFGQPVLQSGFSGTYVTDSTGVVTSGSGVVSALYATDADANQDRSIQPTTPAAGSFDGGSVQYRVVMDRIVEGTQTDGLAAGTTSNFTEATQTITWNTPTHQRITFTSLTAANPNFLSTATQGTYTITTDRTNISDLNNIRHDLEPIGGVTLASNPPEDDGTSSVIFSGGFVAHKDNAADVTTRGIRSVTTYTRPATVTGQSYSITDREERTITAPTYTYPSFWMVLDGTRMNITEADIVSGEDFINLQPQGTVNINSDIKTFQNGPSTTAANVGGGFGTLFSGQTLDFGFGNYIWFGLRSGVTQPTQVRFMADGLTTTFGIYNLVSGLPDQGVIVDDTIRLIPDSSPTGYIAEPYTLYGFGVSGNNSEFTFL